MYYTFPTEEAFNVFRDACDAFFGFPNSEAQTYAQCTRSPLGSSEVLTTVDDRLPPELLKTLTPFEGQVIDFYPNPLFNRKLPFEGRATMKMSDVQVDFAQPEKLSFAERSTKPVDETQPLKDAK